MHTCLDTTASFVPTIGMEPSVDKLPIQTRAKLLILAGGLPWAVGAIAWAIFG